MAHLQQGKRGERSARYLASSHALDGHAQGQRSPCGSDLACRASTGRAHSPGGHGVKKARGNQCLGTQGDDLPEQVMVPADDLPEQGVAPDGRERTTVHACAIPRTRFGPV